MVTFLHLLLQLYSFPASVIILTLADLILQQRFPGASACLHCLWIWGLATVQSSCACRQVLVSTAGSEHLRSRRALIALACGEAL